MCVNIFNCFSYICSVVNIQRIVKQYFLLAIVICISFAAFGQKNNQDMNKFIYEINGFKISPDDRIVYRGQHTAGSDIMPDGSVINWHGYEYVPSTEIDFNKTSLVFLGNTIFFKELLPAGLQDISSLKIIYNSIGYGDNYVIALSALEEKVYIIRDNWVIYTIDVSGYTHVKHMVFKNKQGKLAFIPFVSSKLVEIDVPVDAGTLEYVTLNYYTDKNGLYYFDSYSQQSQKLEDSNGKSIKAVLYDDYFVYGDAAYPYSGTNKPKEIRLNSNKLSYIKTSYSRYLGDGEKLFALPTRVTNNCVPITPQELIKINTPTESVSEWNSFDIITIGGNRKGNTFYYSSKQMYAGSGSYYCLIKTPDNFYGVTGSSSTLGATKLDDVMIYDYNTNKYESIEVDKFRRLTGNFYIYKGQMYYASSYPFISEVNAEKLHPIRLHGKATEFYTDGKYLLGGYNLWKLDKEETPNGTIYKFAVPPFSDVDWQSLQIISEKIMVDKNNIYQVENSVMQVIPIKSLGIDVKVIEELK